MIRLVYQSHYHPQLPIAMMEFLLSELQIGRKYVVMTMGLGIERLTRQLLQHVRVVCALEQDSDKRRYWSSQLDTFSNYMPLAHPPHQTTLEEDTVDAALLVHPIFDLHNDAIRKEFGRVLRLNSYVVVVRHLLLAPEQSFAYAYLHFVQQYNQLGTDPYSKDLTDQSLQHFFAHDFGQKIFPNQLRLDLEGLKGYYLGSAGAFAEDHPQHATALKALKILFLQYQTNGQVALDFETIASYGLFNKYVPAISLRKSLFFNALRPFAFGFYVLVKLNIYFWRIVYRIKERLLGRKSDQ